GGSRLGEAVAGLRGGEVIREAGCEGEYGVIRLMRPENLPPSASLFAPPEPSLFDVPATVPEPAGAETPTADATGASAAGALTTSTPPANGQRPPTGTAAGAVHDQGTAGPRRAGSLLDGLHPHPPAPPHPPGP